MKNKYALLLLLGFLSACNYTLSVKDGKTAWELKRYADAIPMLQKEYKKAESRSEKGRIAYRLGDAYQRSGRPDQALPWFKIAYDNSFGPEALKGYAFALKQSEQYAAAQDAFKNLGIEIGSPYEYRKEVNACIVAEDWRQKAVQTGYSIAPAPFNSPQNDFAPAWLPDGRLVFTSDRSAAQGKARYGWTGQAFMDLFAVDPDAASAQAYDPALNTQTHESTPCFSKKGGELFFVRTLANEKGGHQYCKIFSSALQFDTWTPPLPLPFQKEKINYVHPCLSPDGNTLYFASDDPEGWGGYDLYAVVRQPGSETGWGDPKLLSRNLNTAGNELFPNFDADTLYFASDGLPGMGGLDIFRTYKLDKTTWAPPLNLKSPINSGADDFGLIVDSKSIRKTPPTLPGDLIRSGYFTTNRKTEGARGMDDIFKFEQRVPPPLPPAPKDTTPAAAIVYKTVIEGYVLEKIFTIPDDPNTKVLGRKPLEGAAVEIRWGDKKQRVTVGADGFFRIEALDNTDYVFQAGKNAYLNNSTRFSTKGLPKDPSNPVQTYEVEIVLDKIYRDREIVLENIYYDFDQWAIRPDAEPTLNKLAQMLRENPEIRIELGSHTDCRGNDSYNLTLSQRRAESAVNYLTGKGIAVERLGAVGHGEREPAADCACNRCTEEEHQQNRRTTFTIR